MQVMINKILLFALVIYVSCSNIKSQVDNFHTTEEFVNHIFNILKKNKLDELKELWVSKEELEDLVNKSNVPDQIKSDFKSSFLEGFSSYKEPNFVKERRAYFNIICNNEDVKFVTFKELKVRNPMIFEMSEFKILYECGENPKEYKDIVVQSIKTKNGWKLMGDIY